LEVEYIFQENLWLNEIDPGDFEDSLINLVLNARDAMPEGGQLTIETTNIVLDEIYCRTIPGAFPGEYVQISVSDNGTGISSEHIDHIFEPFFTTKSVDNGTGLGLAMVFGFIKRSDGQVKVYSENQIGTTFRIYLPKTDKLPDPLAKSENQSPLPRGHETILLVDDETELCRLGKTTLESLGYIVLTASDGNQALEKLCGEVHIDLLFSDIVMPGGINGYELAKRGTELVPGLKTLLTSGYSAKAVKKSPNVTFQSELLSKPYTLPVLAKKIREELDRPNTKTTAVSPPQTLAVWSDSFSIGIDEIDNDHKLLIDLFNKCHEASDAEDVDRIHEILDAVLSYTKMHFTREEKVMAFCEYPKLKNHIQVHRLLVNEISEIKKKLIQREIKAGDILGFLKDWLYGHIHGMDKSIMPYVKDRKEQIKELLINTPIDKREEQ